MSFEFEESQNIPHEPPKQYVPDPPKRKRSGIGLVALCLCVSLLSGALGAAGVYAYMNRQSEVSEEEKNAVSFLEGQRVDSVIQSVKVETGKLMSPAQVYAAYVNSTVGITTSVTTNFWGYQSTSAASGSGFVLSQDGYILTNYHVIEDSDSITVSMYDGTEYAAQLIGYDQSNDIAVLKVDAQGLQCVVLGDSDNMNVGDSVLAIGNPLGELTFSLTSGTVSALNRDVTMSDGNTMTLIQTDCAINSGNSGGALFNLYGEVVGITNAKYSGSSGGGATIDNIGFAIPVNDVMDIVKSIIEKGYISRPYIGVSVSDVSAESQSYGLPMGAAVRAVTQDGPAQQAGLQEGDIITHIDGSAVSGSSQLVKIIEDCQAGQQLTLTVYRRGKTQELTVTVGEQIQSAQQQAQPSQQPSQFPFFGF